jgi:hypothetical protein
LEVSPIHTTLPGAAENCGEINSMVLHPGVAVTKQSRKRIFQRTAYITKRSRSRWKFLSCPSQADSEVQAECISCNDSAGQRHINRHFTEQKNTSIRFIFDSTAKMLKPVDFPGVLED